MRATRPCSRDHASDSTRRAAVRCASDESASRRVRRVPLGAVDRGDRRRGRARPQDDQALRRERSGFSVADGQPGVHRRCAREGERVRARRLPGPRRCDRGVRARRAGERGPRCRRRRPDPAVRADVRGRGRRRRDRPVADVSAVPDRGAPRGSRGGRPRSGGHVHVPTEQPDRVARLAVVCAPARRGRGVLRVRGRDGRRPHRRRRRRPADILEGVRARRCTGRVCARGCRDGGRAQPAPGTSADLGDLGRARARGTGRRRSPT